MKYTIFALVILAVAASAVKAQGSCGCIEYPIGEICDALEVITLDPQRTCITNPVQCAGCRCIKDGETATGTCNLVTSNTLYYLDPLITDPGTCDFRNFELAECPTPTETPTETPTGPTPVPNPFTVTCGASQKYGSAFSCTLPTASIGQLLTSLDCTMTFTWSSNFSDNISNPGESSVTTEVVLQEVHTVQYFSGIKFDGSLPDILSTWDLVSGPWVAADLAFETTILPDTWELAIGSNGPINSVYTSKSNLVDVVNSVSGASDSVPIVNARIQSTYNPSFSAGSLNVNNNQRFFSDFRTIVCSWTV